MLVFLPPAETNNAVEGNRVGAPLGFRNYISFAYNKSELSIFNTLYLF